MAKKRNAGAVIGALYRFMDTHPRADLRVGQILLNATALATEGKGDVFYMEDDDLAAAIDKYAAYVRKKV